MQTSAVQPLQTAARDTMTNESRYLQTCTTASMCNCVNLGDVQLSIVLLPNFTGSFQRPEHR